LFEARKRYDLCVLNYEVTSNHVHLVVRDRGEGEIEHSMQLIEGQAGQGYNRRKKRRGAFWQDRYHSTAVDTDEHLVRCLVYVDLNMVRAGVVGHPEQWGEAGYHEIQQARGKRRIIDRTSLSELLGVEEASLARGCTANGSRAAWRVESCGGSANGARRSQSGGAASSNACRSNSGRAGATGRSRRSKAVGYCAKPPHHTAPVLVPKWTV
jgi:putative transposase